MVERTKIHVERALEQRVVEVGGVLVRPGQEGGILTSLDPGPHHAHLCRLPTSVTAPASPEGRRRLPDGRGPARRSRGVRAQRSRVGAERVERPGVGDPHGVLRRREHVVELLARLGQAVLLRGRAARSRRRCAARRPPAGPRRWPPRAPASRLSARRRGAALVEQGAGREGAEHEHADGEHDQHRRSDQPPGGAPEPEPRGAAWRPRAAWRRLWGSGGVGRPAAVGPTAHAGGSPA